MSATWTADVGFQVGVRGVEARVDHADAHAGGASGGGPCSTAVHGGQAPLLRQEGVVVRCLADGHHLVDLDKVHRCGGVRNVQGWESTSHPRCSQTGRGRQLSRRQA